MFHTDKCKKLGVFMVLFISVVIIAYNTVCWVGTVQDDNWNENERVKIDIPGAEKAGVTNRVWRAASQKAQ